MNFLEKFLASQPAVSPKVTTECKLLSYTGTKDVLVAGVAKARIVVTLQIGTAVAEFYMFKDSVYGLPNYVPTTGLTAVATFRENEGYAPNCVSLGVKA